MRGLMKYKIERLNPGRSGAGGRGLNQGKKKNGASIRNSSKRDPSEPALNIPTSTLTAKK